MICDIVLVIRLQSVGCDGMMRSEYNIILKIGLQDVWYGGIERREWNVGRKGMEVWYVDKYVEMWKSQKRMWKSVQISLGITNADAPRNYVNCPISGTFLKCKVSFPSIPPPYLVAYNPNYRMLNSMLHKKGWGWVTDFGYFAQRTGVRSTNTTQPPNKPLPTYTFPFPLPTFPP